MCVFSWLERGFACRARGSPSHACARCFVPCWRSRLGRVLIVRDDSKAYGMHASEDCLFERLLYSWMYCWCAGLCPFLRCVGKSQSWLTAGRRRQSDRAGYVYQYHHVRPKFSGVTGPALIDCTNPCLWFIPLGCRCLHSKCGVDMCDRNASKVDFHDDSGQHPLTRYTAMVHGLVWGGLRV